jgi:hypothetical protein
MARGIWGTKLGGVRFKLGGRAKVRYKSGGGGPELGRNPAPPVPAALLRRRPGREPGADWVVNQECFR